MPRSERARSLRRRQTDAERLLWQRLRSRQLRGLKFRRQHPVGPYVVDLVCLERRLVIELDGGQHAQPEIDAERDAWLTGQRFRIIRFWNDQVIAETEAVLETIARAAAKE